MTNRGLFGAFLKANIQMIDFYTIPSLSPNVRKALVMLAETGLPYSVVRLERQGDGKLPEAFSAINPNATVPAIVDRESGEAIFESGAILYYLALKSGKLLSADPGVRGQVMKWLMFEAANVGPAMGELYHYLLKAPEGAEAVVPRYQDKVARYCSILERQLEGREYLCGDYSIADVALYPWTAIVEEMAEVDLASYPNLRRWADTIGRRPAAQATY